jgi:hypothetical protein
MPNELAPLCCNQIIMLVHRVANPAIALGRPPSGRSLARTHAMPCPTPRSNEPSIHSPCNAARSTVRVIVEGSCAAETTPLPLAVAGAKVPESAGEQAHPLSKRAGSAQGSAYSHTPFQISPLPPLPLSLHPPRPTVRIRARPGPVDSAV